MNNQYKNDISLQKSCLLKMNLLTHGVCYDDKFLTEFNMNNHLLEKRRAYGNSDQKVFDKNIRVPQEILLPHNLMVATNYREDSLWKLTYNQNFYLTDGHHKYPILIPERPDFYDTQLSESDQIQNVVSIYGHETLAIFSPGHCFYFNNNLQCRFCSLKQNRDNYSDHLYLIKPEVVAKTLDAIFKSDEKKRIKRVMINGGNLSDYDRGFKRHLEIIKVIHEQHPNIPLRLITMPPKNLNLIEELKRYDIKLVMCLEVFNPELFEKICPGKHMTYGRSQMFDAYKKALEILGPGNVYCGLVAGIEPVESILEGLEFCNNQKLVPAVNVLHNDPGTDFENHPRPTIDFLQTVGKKMADIYRKNQFVPFIENSGRNSLDTEAYLDSF